MNAGDLAACTHPIGVREPPQLPAYLGSQGELDLSTPKCPFPPSGPQGGWLEDTPDWRFYLSHSSVKGRRNIREMIIEHTFYES